MSVCFPCSSTFRIGEECQLVRMCMRARARERARDRAEGYGLYTASACTIPYLTLPLHTARPIFRRTRMPILAVPEAHTSSFDFPFPFPFLHLPSFFPFSFCILPKLEIVEGGPPLRSARTP